MHPPAIPHTHEYGHGRSRSYLPTPSHRVHTGVFHAAPCTIECFYPPTVELRSRAVVFLAFATKHDWGREHRYMV